MITQDDLAFHTPAAADPQWAETYWLGFYVPEANLYGWIYMVFRAATGAVVCDVEFIDRKSFNMFDARYIDIQNHLKIPADLASFRLANGLQFNAKSPREYRVDYIGVADTEIHLDFVGIHEPYDIHDPEIDPMARASADDAVEHSGFGSAYASHFDLTMRATGWVKVRGQRYEVNSLATNDHSWGPRPERGMRMMAYMNAHFADDYVLQSIWEFDAGRPDGEQHTFKHGYVVIDKELRGCTGGSLTVRHRGFYPDSLEFTLTDVSGVDHRVEGAPLAFCHWVPYGCCPTGHSMVSWSTEGRSGGVGTLMEAYPLDTVTGGYLHSDIRESGSQFPRSS